MDLKAESYQFLSRSNFNNKHIGSAKTSPKDHPNIIFHVDYEICGKPFEINFSEVIPRRPSIGAYQYIDPEIDLYMQKRWPKTLKASAKITFGNQFEFNNEGKILLLLFLRVVLWHLRNHDKLAKELFDQPSRTPGYRRQYFSSQIFDIAGNRIPNSSRNYVPTNIGDYIGPGIAFFPNQTSFDSIDQFVWSQIIPFPNQTGKEDDIPIVYQKAYEITKHYNSYNELSDARKHLIGNDTKDIKACIRSAASAIDAILKYYCNIWQIQFPKRDLQFDEKIEDVLRKANMPSYKEADPESLLKLLYLYRARNSMHEGDCYYKDNEGNQIEIKTKEQAELFLKAAESFTLWIDSIA